MCWNKEVSLNTFLFSSGVLALIWYNNTYTQYKTRVFSSIWSYVFAMSIISMQLIEFFIWTYIKQPWYNSMFSILATILLLVQPVASLMMITDTSLRNKLIGLYILLVSPYSMYRFLTRSIYSQISDRGHLDWQFLSKKGDEWILFLGWVVWLIFLLFPFFYIGTYEMVWFALINLMIIIYNYYVDKTVGSMWCWIVNSIMIYYAGYILFYLPFIQG